MEKLPKKTLKQLPKKIITRKYAAACYFMTLLFIKKIGGERFPPVYPSPDTALFSIANNYIGILIITHL